MGFQKTRMGGKAFAHISDGFIVVPTVEGDSVGEIEAEERVNAKGRTVWELNFPSFTGHILGASIKENEEFGDRLLLKMVDMEAPVTDRFRYVNIELPLSSAYAKNFFMRMNSMDLNEPIGLRPYHMPHDSKPGKFVNGVSFYAGEIKKENKIEEDIDRDDVPDMVQKKVKGKLQWDDSEQIEYLTERFEEWLNEVEFPEEVFPDGDDEDEDEKPRKVIKKSKPAPAAKAKAKKKVVDEDEEEEDEEEAEEEEEEEEEVEHPAKRKANAVPAKKGKPVPPTKKKFISKAAPAAKKNGKKNIDLDDDEIPF